MPGKEPAVNTHARRLPRWSLWLLLGLAPLAGGCLGLHKAAARGDLEQVDRYLQKGVDVDARDGCGRTPLMWTLSNPAVVRHLVEHGADVNARDINGETPLMKAAFLGQADVVELLCEQGADIHARSRRGETPLMWTYKDPDIVRYLVGRGADVNAADDQGETLLLKMAQLGRLDIVRYLLEQGADVNAGGTASPEP